MLAENPDLTPQELEARIVATPSRILNPEPAYAGGRVATVAPQAPTVLVTLAP